MAGIDRRRVRKTWGTLRTAALIKFAWASVLRGQQSWLEVSVAGLAYPIAVTALCFVVGSSLKVTNGTMIWCEISRAQAKHGARPRPAPKPPLSNNLPAPLLFCSPLVRLPLVPLPR